MWYSEYLLYRLEQLALEVAKAYYDLAVGEGNAANAMFRVRTSRADFLRTLRMAKNHAQRKEKHS